MRKASTASWMSDETTYNTPSPSHNHSYMVNDQENWGTGALFCTSCNTRAKAEKHGAS